MELGDYRFSVQAGAHAELQAVTGRRGGSSPFIHTGGGADELVVGRPAAHHMGAHQGRVFGWHLRQHGCGMLLGIILRPVAQTEGRGVVKKSTGVT